MYIYIYIIYIYIIYMYMINHYMPLISPTDVPPEVLTFHIEFL